MTPLEVEPDHLVVAATDLSAGCDWVEERLGARPQPGGKHVVMGTHNALLSLGARFYLEVIAVDPEGRKPDRPRWFDLDEPRMRAALAEGPLLAHWVARTRDIDDAAARVPDLGTPVVMARGDLTWRITIPDDGHRPGRGLVPTLIEWPDTRHPTDALSDSGCRLVAVAGEHPEPALVRAELALLGLSETMKVTYGKSPRLAAMVRTSRGIATL
ncbi:MAG TPA: VOC family protein [Casimicrobiaceae bacterium]|nr:VOC family protein [Casimicrobiaceae bacterium]